MSQIFRIALMAALIIFSLTINFAQGSKQVSIYKLLELGQNLSEEDKVYSQSQVTKKAVILSKPAPKTSSDCPDKGLTRVRVVLHKSGKVTDVELIRGVSCGFDENSIKAARKIKFTPAVKDGVPVSQYVIIEYYYTRY